MAHRAGPALAPPFLRHLSLIREAMAPGTYPFDLPILRGGELEIAFERPVTILVGENGTGKSTLLEAIADQCGFNLRGGNRNHRYGGDGPGREAAALARALRLAWLPRMTTGFFLRAETFFDLASHLDALGSWNADALEAFAGKAPHELSHGEAFLAFFGSRLGRRGIYIMDEPEAALSPSRQLAFLALLKEAEATRQAQILIATHSPILMAYPGAQLLEIASGAVRAGDYRETSHFRLMRRFLADPERYLAEFLDGRSQ
jgi:predicted ATPase